MNNKILVAILFFININFVFSQNTLSYTQTEAHYNNAIELFEKKAYSSSRKEFSEYIKKSEKSLDPNKFNIANAEYYSALASLYSNAKDADIEVGRFVVKNPDHPKAKLIFSDLAKSFLSKGDYNGAIDYFKQALENREDNLETFELRYQLGLAYYLLKDYKNALSEFDYVKASSAPNAINAVYYAAVINFQNENFDLALADLKRVENVNPYKIEVPNWIAQILFRQKKYDELLAYSEPIIANPSGRKIDDICLVSAEACFFENQYEKAAVYYDKFKNFRRGSVSEQVTFRHAYSLYKTESFEKAGVLFKQIGNANSEIGQQSAYYLGISALKGGNLTSAMGAFETAKKLDFDKDIKEEATYNLIKVLVEKNNNQLAITELQAYLKNYPKGKYVDDSNELLSEILFETNNYISAISYIEGLSRKTPKIEEAYQKLTYNQGVIEYNSEKFESSIGYFNKSLANSPNAKLKTDAKFWKAEASYHLGKADTEDLYKELSTSSDNDIKLKSIYNLGYVYFNQKNYKKAIVNFEEFLNKSTNNTNLSQNREDALIRIADCYLVNKDYTQALKYYDLAYKNNKTDKDYSLYQKGLTLKYLNRDAEAKQAFDAFTTNYGSSRLIDDVLYQNALIELEKSNYQAAVTIFTDLLRKKPNSTLAPQVLLKRALSFSNLKNNTQAISDYKVILNKFGNTEFADEALIGVREALNAENRSEEFFDIAAQYQKSNPNANSVTNLQFDSAKDLYYAEKYEKAITALKNYINAYPNSASISEANYLIAESYFLLNNKTEALTYYQEIVNNKQLDFLTKSALRSAAIYFETQKYSDAISNYQTVLGSTSNKREQVISWEGLYKSYYFTGNYDKAIEFCTKVLEEGGNTVVSAENRALLFNGKALMQKGKIAEAKTEFEKVIAIAKDVNGAEAKYFIADMQFKSKDYDTSIKTLQELSNDFSEFGFWYEKSFLLIADNYIGKKDIFMAKATLNSIIDNSENKQTIETAKQKLKALN